MPLIVIPAITNFWANRKSSTTGSIDMLIAAMEDEESESEEEIVPVRRGTKAGDRASRQVAPNDNNAAAAPPSEAFNPKRWKR